MRNIHGCLLVLLLTVAPAAAQRAEVDYWATLEAWVGAIERHEPGRNDESVLALAAIPDKEFDATIPYMVYLLDRAQGQHGTRAFDDLFRRLSGDIPLTPTEALRLKTLLARLSPARLKPFLKRAAMLHTDVTVFYPEGQLTAIEGTGYIAADGRARGDRGRSWHWMLARSFLHLALTDSSDPRRPRLVPDSDPDIRLWYQAVANHFWSQRNYTEGLPHVRRALELFPDDAELHFVRGLIHEAQAGPHIQAAVREQAQAFARQRSASYIPSVKTADEERAEAAAAFRRALATDPAHVEARLHLAHVLNVEGRYADAARELESVLARAESNWHRYFAFLFLGRAEEGRERPAEARQAFEAAAALFPEAQAPRVAISQIDLRAGDRAGAMRVFDFLARERGRDADPLWRYDAVRMPDADVVWLDRARAAFRASAR